MAKAKTALTIGLEEELFLVDANTGELCRSWPEQFSNQCSHAYPDQIVHEFLACQVEIITKPHSSINSLHQEYYNLRSHLIDTSAKFGLSPLASSTHPVASWCEQMRSPSPRYSKLEQELQISAHRLLASGMHFHIGIECTELRIRVMNFLVRFLPLFLGLTTSSPFWRGIDSGLNSSRLSVLNALPRSGLPYYFSSYQDYQQYIDAMILSGAIDSAKEIWWDVRLNANYPTVEVRVTETCTNMADAMALCAFFQSLVHHFIKHGDSKLFACEDFFNLENKWRVQRYSIHSLELLTQGGRSQSFRTIIEKLISELEQDARELGCYQYLLGLNKILEQGTSADKQRSVYQQAIKKGCSKEESLSQVIDFLIQESAYLTKPCIEKKTVESSDECIYS